MKSAKLIDIFKQGHIVIPLFMLQHYKELKLEIGEFLFLMYLYNLGNKFIFDPSKFASDLNLDIKDVMNYIGTLSDKHFIRVEVMKNDKGLMEEMVLMDDFYSKLSLITMDEVNNVSSADNSNIYEIIEKEFGRTLSPMEYEIIRAWLDNDMSEELIQEAIKEATYNGVSNLRYIDKILYEWSKLGIKTAKDVSDNKKKRAKAKEEASSDVDMDIMDWDWFDDDE
ncbi:MAG: DnaD domain protein [Bacilli bacterium]|nr:DnaD domain protein [Mycoplasmatota bacterium]MDD6941927.1 DnaD domain protein [bacterium]MDY2696912.1 DnaD domain protein [Bacilli bacterium]MDY5992710.1 DnaD domain protein [Bacilli bacterium]MEE0014551.1 DnaD domain protein [Bacilli bacterium]